MNALSLQTETVAEGFRMAWIDIGLLVCLLLAIWLGARRGIWWQLVRLLGVVATLALARAFAPRLSPGLNHYLDNLSPTVANGLMWGCILVLGLSVVALVGRLGKLALDGAAFTPLDRVGGALLGLLSMALVFVGGVVVASQIASPQWNAKYLRETKTQMLVDQVARWIPDALDPLASERAAPQVWAAEK
jgi:uncharacterized membrane protein required for colicin V production